MSSRAPEESDIPRSGRRDVKADQEHEDRERKGQRQAAVDPAKVRDPRGNRKPPQPFSGPSR